MNILNLFKSRPRITSTQAARDALGIALPPVSAELVIDQAMSGELIHHARPADPLTFDTIGAVAVGPARAVIKAVHKYSVDTHLQTTATMVKGLNARAEALRLEQEADIQAWQEGDAARAEAARIAADDLAKATARRAQERAEIDRLLNFYQRAPELMAVAAPAPEPAAKSDWPPAAGSRIEIDGAMVEVCGNRASNARRVTYDGRKIYVRDIPPNSTPEN